MITRAFMIVGACMCAAACTIGAKDAAPLAPTPPPSTAPSSIQVLAASRADLRVDVTAVVTTAQGKAVPDVAVTFSASSGTLNPETATTDSTGAARAVLTPQTERTTVRAEAAGLTSSANVLSSLPPGPNPPTPTPPPPNPDPVPPLTVTINVQPQPAGNVTTFSLSTQAMASASWSFGDGGAATTSTGSTMHLYATAGSYPVSVTVTDVRGRTASSSTVANIPATPDPGPQPMIVLLKPSAASVGVGGTVTFTATIDNLLAGETVTAYQWDLDGNGSFESTTTTPARTSAPYATAGFVTARVSITTNLRSGGGAVSIVVTN